MSTISRKMIEAYDSALSQTELKAQKSAEAAFDAWRAKNLHASIAEIREEMKAIVLAELDSYGNAACELGARFYDQCVENSSASLDPASIPDVTDETRDAIDRKCRWIAGLIADEDDGSAI